jgi:hypothetical protein
VRWLTTTSVRGRELAVVGGLAAFQVLLTLFVLARSSHRALPGLPLYRFNPLEGDAYGYYSAVRELLNTWQREGRVLVPLTVVVCAASVVIWRRADNGLVRALALVWACGILAASLVERIRFTGAAQIGWSLVWSALLLPYRAVGLPLGPNVAFAFGLTLSLACNALTVVMTYELGRLATDRRGVAVIAAALVAAWPLLMLLDPDHTSAQNGTWQILLGLSMYTEPLSTALVLSGIVILLRRPGAGADAVIGGALLGLAALVRVSNGLIAACVVLALLMRGDSRRAVAAGGGGLAFLPALVLFWPKGYPHLQPPVYPAHPFELAYARTAWTHSLLWHPVVLVVIVPLAILGAFFVNRAVAVVLGSAVVATAVLYSFYELTPLHPRFLFVALPAVFVFWAAGVSAIASLTAALYDRAR